MQSNYYEDEAKLKNSNKFPTFMVSCFSLHSTLCKSAILIMSGYLSSIWVPNMHEMQFWLNFQSV